MVHNKRDIKECKVCGEMYHIRDNHLDLHKEINPDIERLLLEQNSQLLLPQVRTPEIIERSEEQEEQVQKEEAEKEEMIGENKSPLTFEGRKVTF